MRKTINNQGFSLLELLLAVGIFSMIIVVIAGIYIGFSRTQAEVRASQRLLNDSQYAMELMAREIRNNAIFDFNPTAGDCQAILGPGYSSCIILQREDSNLVAFAFYNNILFHIILSCNEDYSSCSWGSANSYVHLLSLAVNKVQVDDLDFYIWPGVDPYQGDSDDQPRVTIRLRTKYFSEKKVEQVNHILQTTVSSRIYRR